MNKINNYLGLCRKANYLIIGSDNLKDYHKKLYLIIVNKDITNTISKIVKDKLEEYENVNCIVLNENFGLSIGVANCKIIGIKNKGMAEVILQQAQEYKFWNK